MIWKQQSYLTDTIACDKDHDRNSFIQFHWRVKQERGKTKEPEEEEDKYSRSLCSGVKVGHGTLSQRHSRSSIYNVTNIPNSYQLRRGKGQNVDRIMAPFHKNRFHCIMQKFTVGTFFALIAQKYHHFW